MTLRVGVCLLQEKRWQEDRPRWEQAGAAGFRTLWTYDHLSWRSLRDGPWLGAVPLLTAAAAVTTARIGLLVATPNFRHPVPFAKDLVTLDDVSDGRLDVGLGSGGTGADSTVLGRDVLPPRQRMDRFEEFVELLDLLLRQPATTWHGDYFAAEDARMIPGCRQSPRVPLTVAATGPRGLALAARYADTWVTYGPGAGAEQAPAGDWWPAVRRQRDLLTGACERLGRDPASIARMALVSLDLSWPQSSPAAWDDFTGTLATEGFTDVVIHWPRPQDPDLPGPAPATFDHVAQRL